MNPGTNRKPRRYYNTANPGSATNNLLGVSAGSTIYVVSACRIVLFYRDRYYVVHDGY